MDKNKDNTFDVPAADVQDKITSLMGLPPDEAAAQLDKVTPPQRVVTDSVPTVDRAEVSTIEQNPQVAEKPTLKQVDVASDDAAVDDIIAHEKQSSQNMKNDFDVAADYSIIKSPKNVKSKNKKRKIFLRIIKISSAMLLVVLATLLIIPTSRYAVLNFIGLKASMSVTVVDDITGRPIKNVTVRVADVTAQTDTEGVARLESLPIGKTDMIVQKRSFKEIIAPVTIGWGSNPFKTPIELVATGTTYTIKTTDCLSGLPLKGVAISDGDSEAISNDSGEAKLTIEPTETDTKITATLNGYRLETIMVPADTQTIQSVTLVPSQKDVFVTKRNGTYDVYTRYIDGSEETAVLPGTGLEQLDTRVLPSQSLPIAALVSSRAGERSSAGVMQSDVYIISTDTKQVVKVPNTSSDQLRMVGWEGPTLVFVASTMARQTANSTTPAAERLLAFNTVTQSIKELAAAEYIQNPQLSSGAVYYVMTKNQTDNAAGLTKVSIATAEKQALLTKQIWAVYQQNFDTLQVNTEGNEWYEITKSSGKTIIMSGAPPILQTKQYAVSPSGAAVAWVEDRDGKTSILTAGTKDSTQTEIIKQQGVLAPIRWLSDDVILYTVVTPQETAHYVVSTTNGQSKKIGDVSVSPYASNGYN